MDQIERGRRIAELAYRMWRDEGFPEGRDFVHWLEAERLVDQECAQRPGKASPASIGRPRKGDSSGNSNGNDRKQ